MEIDMLTQFVAFLRGVNVGGHNMIKKEKFQEVFNNLGFISILTYRQSGNVIFETKLKEEKVIAKQIQQELGLTGCDITVFLRSINQLKTILSFDPFKNSNVKNASFLVTFFSIELKVQIQMPIKIPNSTAEVILINDREAYSVTHGHGEGGKPNPFLELKFKTCATTRNWNIIRELADFTNKAN